MGRSKNKRKPEISQRIHEQAEREGVGQGAQDGE